MGHVDILGSKVILKDDLPWSAMTLSITKKFPSTLDSAFLFTTTYWEEKDVHFHFTQVTKREELAHMIVFN